MSPISTWEEEWQAKWSFIFSSTQLSNMEFHDHTAAQSSDPLVVPLRI